MQKESQKRNYEALMAPFPIESSNDDQLPPYEIGNILSLISSILLTFAFLGIIFAGSKKNKKNRQA